MLSGRWPLPHRGWLIAAAVLCMALLSQATPVWAHVSHPGKELLYEGVQGPYFLQVQAVPYVGYLHVTVVFNPGSSAPLPYEPVVRVSAEPTGAEGKAVGPMSAQREPLSTTHEYSATLNAGEEGPWTVLVDIESSAGQASFPVPVTLRQPPGIPFSAVLTGLGLLLPVLWLIGSGIRDRMSSGGKPARRRPRARQV